VDIGTGVEQLLYAAREAEATRHHQGIHVAAMSPIQNNAGVSQRRR
jgi:hypothetical protein